MEYEWGVHEHQLQPPFDVVLASECIVPKLYPIEPFVEALARLSGPQTLVLVAIEFRLWHEYNPAHRFEELCLEKGMRAMVVPAGDMHEQYQADDIWIWSIAPAETD